MKPYVRGKTIYFREVQVQDAQFVLDLRTDPEKGKHLSQTTNEIQRQENFITQYLESETDFYFIICDYEKKPIGTIRIYDIKDNSFCWGSWILSSYSPKNAAIESALLIYDFAFFSLHYGKAHFDVRKENERVVDFHKRFGARVAAEDDQNLYFEYNKETYLKMREKYQRFLPS